MIQVMEGQRIENTGTQYVEFRGNKIAESMDIDKYSHRYEC
jgi:hypothetical protein